MNLRVVFDFVIYIYNSIIHLIKSLVVKIKLLKEIVLLFQKPLGLIIRLGVTSTSIFRFVGQMAQWQ